MCRLEKAALQIKQTMRRPGQRSATRASRGGKNGEQNNCFAHTLSIRCFGKKHWRYSVAGTGTQEHPLVLGPLCSPAQKTVDANGPAKPTQQSLRDVVVAVMTRGTLRTPTLARDRWLLLLRYLVVATATAATTTITTADVAHTAATSSDSHRSTN